MSVITLGLSGFSGRDAAAAIFIDDKLVAAIEEERLLRRKGAKDILPYRAARQCLQVAGIAPSHITQVALPYAPISLFSKARWHYAYRHWYAPDRSIDSILNGNRRFRRYRQQIRELLTDLHVPANEVKILPIEHQLAHAASVYQMVDIREKTAILSIDSGGEYSSILLGYGDGGKIIKRKEFYSPDSLSGMYEAMADYLGFEKVDGEFKVMGMSLFGDADKYDLSMLRSFDGNKFKVNSQLISTVGLRRYKAKSKGHFFSQKLVDLLGPPRIGKLVDDPYVHYAAAIQKLHEDTAVALVRRYLADVLQETGRLAITGTGALNIRLNQRLRALPEVRTLVVHPACGDAGTAIGAAAAVIHRDHGSVKPLRNVFLGPSYSSEQCVHACTQHRERPLYELVENPAAEAARLLAEGELIAWFQGRMEFGARALGNRSILANPTQENVADEINREVKFRERWRPFSASLLEGFADEFFVTQKDGESATNLLDEYMCVSTEVRKKHQQQYPSIVFKDGTIRAQVVRQEANPRFHELISEFEKATGHSLVINTALSRSGEALVNSPEDALNLFHGTDLQYLIMENVLVRKREEPEDW